ncbi:cellulose biosynthesis cyclic di-GMP-binding regulatory protein BcsB [Vibrio sp. S17_S38]|uniref:cellulose biosynthesis cyclic di-GMP-binding regulatory protein BcsB n=1 Tax=Vibrio sp. S17_S38 TaxID=2720229 RepID=UPI00168074B6|nr:cellulose biosynthesis cyclic di-GMP-binding regulatory protein BcsB [Vibrio sp. S17_S38]MBD1574115.1 cellulose biosynthesis cyclic di-GMP-binding regulatory protein BcsB [Vibrio sp. S17_S38]
MWMNKKMKALACAMSLASVSNAAFTMDTAAQVVTSPTAKLSAVSPVVEKRTLLFNQLGYSSSIRMQGTESNVYVGFGSRLDEIVSQGSVSFNFIPSPALLAQVSHVKVYFNNELMGVVAITSGSQGKRIKATIPLEPRLFSNYNQLRFELIGNASEGCGNPNDGSIWAEIGQESHIDLSVHKTQLNNDLSLLPAPFFDSRDFSPLKLPMVFGQDIDMEEIKAAGIASSYFGSLADTRGTDFPVLRNKIPDQNAIVFVTDSSRPDFLKDYPMADGPRLQIISHPTKPFVKLLIVSGHDSKDLTQAIKGLAFGQHLLTGPIAKITRIEQIMPRKPYDAPNWINTKRPVLLSEMVEYASNLQVEGQTPPPMNVSFRLPPDLFTWQSRGIPFDLSYRYSPPQTDNSGSRMSLSINNQFVQAFNLNTKGESENNSRIRVPMLDDGVLGSGDQIRIPAFKVGSRNDLKFEFGFSSSTSGDSICQTSQPSKQYAAIDGNSSLDFSGYPHYIEMPNMRAFASSGFPFTRMADLSETAVVLSKQPSDAEIGAFINMMGRFGINSGYPAIGIQVTSDWSKEALKDKDILAIGVMAGLHDVSENNPPNMLLKDGLRFAKLPNRNERQQGKNWVNPSTHAPDPADEIEVSATGDFASLTSYQSPFNKQRTVVNLLAESPKSLALINSALNDSGKVDAMFGSVVSVRDGSVASFNVGEHYYVGSLPVWQLISYHFSQYPILMALAAMFLVILVTIALWRILSRIARSRLKGKED